MEGALIVDLENKVDEIELEKPKKKKNTGLIVAIILVFLLVAGIIALLIGGMNFVNAQLDKITREEINRNELAINEGVREDLAGYRNILLLGIDARDMESDENTRSDAMIIVSIDKETRDIRMISIYRDTYLDLGERVGLDKLTHAYFYGGAQQTVAAINKNMDLNIEEFIVVNWRLLQMQLMLWAV
jgi:anionic cell wall polymer biosynthesis LytR-Cps2A-Psr (LCP) family protein